jgi:hypothetical protein
MAVDERCLSEKEKEKAAYKRQPLAVPSDMMSIGFDCFVFRFLPAILV